MCTANDVKVSTSLDQPRLAASSAVVADTYYLIPLKAPVATIRRVCEFWRT
jgi:hypothetical protein